MGDLFHEKADRDLFFSSFGTDIGSRLDQLKFEFEEIESGKIKQTVKSEDAPDSNGLESLVQNEIEKKINDDSDSDKEKDKEHRSRTYTMIRAISTVSLMANFKSGFWRKKRGSKKSTGSDDTRRGSTSSTPENNNTQGLPKITISGDSEGRSTIYSTVPRKPKNASRSHTMSPTRTRLGSDGEIPEQLQRTESGNVFVPPVIMDGKVVHDYQYATPELSPKKAEANKFARRNSLSRLFRIRKSPKKSPKKDTTPIKHLYEKTVMTASNNELHRVHENGHNVIVGDATANTMPRKHLAST